MRVLFSERERRAVAIASQLSGEFDHCLARLVPTTNRNNHYLWTLHI